MSAIGERLESIRSSLREAAERAGHEHDVTLVAVTKMIEAERIREAIDGGQRVFGENRVQEAIAKMNVVDGLDVSLNWHLLGHLQSNKVKSAVGRFSCIQSVDTVRLAAELNRRGSEAGVTVPILLEVNVGGETSKSGFKPADLEHDIGAILSLPSLQTRGLMTVAPYADEPEDIRWVFRHLRELRDCIRGRYHLDKFTELSMGMSNDYVVAVQEGATMVRIGRALFGDRPPTPGVRKTW
jgi:PLP dependent protein